MRISDTPSGSKLENDIGNHLSEYTQRRPFQLTSSSLLFSRHHLTHFLPVDGTLQWLPTSRTPHRVHGKDTVTGTDDQIRRVI